MTSGFNWQEYHLEWLVVFGMVLFVGPLAWIAYEIVLGSAEQAEDELTKRFGGK